MAIFFNSDISQGSIATRLGCGGVFVYDFVTNLLLSLTVKEFWKSVNIWWSYAQELAVLFFLTDSVVVSSVAVGRVKKQFFANFAFINYFFLPHLLIIQQ